MAIFNFLRWQTRPYLHLWRLTLPPPLKGVPLIFFHQNDRKGCTLNCLDGLGPFLFGLGATGKKLERWLFSICLSLSRWKRLFYWVDIHSSGFLSWVIENLYLFLFQIHFHYALTNDALWITIMLNYSLRMQTWCRMYKYHRLFFTFIIGKSHHNIELSLFYYTLVTLQNSKNRHLVLIEDSYATSRICCWFPLVTFGLM